MLDERIGKNVKESDRGLIYGIFPEFAWRN
jgi:hypothetical protein